MRRFKHWTPRYIYNRVALFIYQLNNPDAPWLTRYVNEFLACWLKETDVGMEWGSGRSTVWFAKRVKQLNSFEHNKRWYGTVSGKLNKLKVSEVVTLCYVDIADNREKNNYIGNMLNIEDNSLDFVLVDGVFRDKCALLAIDKVKPGGILIVDNINWYLPRKCPSSSPNSRGIKDGFESKLWEEFSQHTSGWRNLWTSNGVWDTAIWFKPCL